VLPASTVRGWWSMVMRIGLGGVGSGMGDPHGHP
jgi:hypothetical protein